MALAAHSDGPIHNIIEIPGLSKSTVLQHLRELKRAGLIQGNLYGSKTQYSIDMTKINEFDAKFKDFMITLRNPNP
jgi:DNA-binding transcriptional ArsR family regulator